MPEAATLDPPPRVAPPPAPPPLPRGWLRRAGFRHRSTAVALGWVVFIVLACLAGPLFLPTSPTAQNLALGATPPGPQHWLGTDLLGRDLLARMLAGGRVSFAVAGCATLVALVIGVTWGVAAGFFGGRVDAFLMRIVDVLYALPFTVFVILLMVFFGRSFVLLFVAIGAVEWLTTARIVRGQTLVLRRQEFVTAARALGAHPLRIMARHILPNLAGPVIAYTTINVPAIMMLEAFLSFLGLGVQPPHSSWGILLKEGSELMELYPWLLIAPATAFVTTLLALNTLGDALCERFDPRRR